MGWNRILSALKSVGTYATANRVVVAYEPVNHLETAYSNTIAAVASVVRDINLSGLQLMVDEY